MEIPSPRELPGVWSVLASQVFVHRSEGEASRVVRLIVGIGQPSEVGILIAEGITQASVEL